MVRRLLFWGGREGQILDHSKVHGSTFQIISQDECSIAYMICHREVHVLLEVCSSNPNSWFIDQSILEHGNVTLAVPIDPILLLLSSLKQYNSVFMLKSQMLNGIHAPLLTDLISKEQLKLVCDTKTAGDEEVYRFNDKKAIEYGAARVLKMAKTLALSQGTSNTVSSTANSFVMTSSKDTKPSGESDILLKTPTTNHIRECTRIFGDLIGHSWSQRISELLNVSLTEQVPELHQKNKSPKQDTPAENKTNTRKASTLSAANKRLAKTNTSGMRTLTSFFTKSG